MKIALLGSGSVGNSIFLEINGYKFLIDAGFTGKKLKEKLLDIGENINNIQAVLITHEHSDHILGAGVISRAHDIPIYITKESFLASKNRLGNISESLLHFITGDSFLLNQDITINPFDVLHDANRTIGFSIINNKKNKISIATDIGYVTSYVREQFKDSNIIVIESNYDYNMLMNGPYPWDLKSRVKSKTGHLSNNGAAKLLNEVYHDGLKKVFLAHISENNNDYSLAYNTSLEELSKNNISLDLEIGKPNKVSNLFEL